MSKCPGGRTGQVTSPAATSWPGKLIRPVHEPSQPVPSAGGLWHAAGIQEIVVA